MPSIKDKSTIEALARAFIENGRCKAKAMEKVGYTPAYAKSYCGHMWANKALIKAINQIDAKMQANSAYTIEKYQQELDQARQRAISGKSHAAEVSAIVAKGRSMGFDKDNRADTDATHELDAAEAADRKAFTEWQLRQSLNIKREA